MGLAVETPDFFYENCETRRERQAHEDVSHCVGKDGDIRTRIRSRTGVSTSGRSAKSRSTDRGKRSRPPRQPCAASRSAASCKSPRPPSSKGDGRSRSVTADQRPLSNVERCYEMPPRLPSKKCTETAPWQNGEYRRDECGSGIVPVNINFMRSRKIWCKTPLSMYQATIGELGREILCREKIVPRDVKPGPPCNIDAIILPPCRGYYRKYDCLRPCEEMYAYKKAGQKTYRNEVDRYWEPCRTREQNGRPNVNEFAGQNVFLRTKLRRKIEDLTCW